MIKKWIIKIFKINTYEKEYKKYEELYQNALTDIEVITSVAENYKRELDNLKATSNGLIKTAEDVLAMVNDPDRKREYYEHRAYASGRQCAYAEMGIKALDARAEGKTLYVDHDDNLIEELDEESFEKFCEENEIRIGDLVEGASDEKLDREQSIRITQYTYHPNEKIKTRIWLVKQQTH